MTTTYTTGKDGLPHIPKIAGKKLDFTFDLTAYMEAIGASVLAYTITATGLTYDADEDVREDEFITAFLDGGTPGYSYHVHIDFTITGAPTREDRRTIVVDVVAVR